MPLMPSINIHTTDLQRLIEMLESRKIGQCQVKIVDDGERYAVRDSGGFLIGYLPKQVIHENQSG